MLLYKYLLRWRNKIYGINTTNKNILYGEKLLNLILNKNDKEKLLEAFNKWRYGKSEKVPKPVRYILIALISLFFLAAIGLIIFLGIDALKNSKLAGIIVISMGVLLLILAIMKFKKIYIKKRNNFHK